MNRPTPGPPLLASLFTSFVSIGMMSFGGGLAAWTRREVVQKRGWLDDKQFLSGYALSQLVPGATNVNLAVFIGTQMRGTAGAIACFCGLTALPVTIVLLLGVLYLHSQEHVGGTWIRAAGNDEPRMLTPIEPQKAPTEKHANRHPSPN